MLAQADRNKKPPLLKSVAEAIHGSVTKIVEGDCYDLSQFPLCLTVRCVLFDKHLFKYYHIRVNPGDTICALPFRILLSIDKCITNVNKSIVM